jgi:HEAT repeat protein
MQPPEPVRTIATHPVANWNKPQAQSAPATQQVEPQADSNETSEGGIGDFDACRKPRPSILYSVNAVRLDRWFNQREIKLPKEVKELVKLLGTQDAEVRRAIAYDLSVYGDVQAVDALSGLLAKDPDPKVRGEAFDSLCDIMRCSGDRLDGKKFLKIVDLLFMALTDREESVRKIAEDNFLIRKWSMGSLAGVAIRTKKTRLLSDALARQLTSDNSKVRHAAVEVLGNLDREALPVLRKVSKNDPDQTIRDVARKAIKKILHPPLAEEPPFL